MTWIWDIAARDARSPATAAGFACSGRCALGVYRRDEFRGVFVLIFHLDLLRAHTAASVADVFSLSERVNQNRIGFPPPRIADVCPLIIRGCSMKNAKRPRGKRKV